MIIGIMGQLGSGKTLTASLLGLTFLKLSNYKLKLYANYDLKLSKKFKNLKELLNLKNAIIIFDELHQNLDSRTWWDNQDLIYFFLQLRKKNNFLIYTTQHIKQIDLRLRNLTNFIIYTVKTKNFFKIYIFDGFDYILLKSFILPIEFLKEYKIFQIYNTFEFIQPLQ